MLELADVHTYYGNIRALRGVSPPAPGEIVTLIGSNGAGKTTTLKTILGTASRAPRHRHVQRPASRYALDRSHRASRHRPVAGGPSDFSADERAGEFELAFARRPRGDRLDLERVFAPSAVVPASTAGRHPLRRRAADARHRARIDGTTHPALARRAVDGPGADPGRDDFPHHRGHQPPGHDDPARRAERKDGARRRASRLRHADRSHRAAGRGRGALALDLVRRPTWARSSAGACVSAGRSAPRDPARACGPSSRRRRSGRYRTPSSIPCGRARC